MYLIERHKNAASRLLLSVLAICGLLLGRSISAQESGTLETVASQAYVSSSQSLDSGLVAYWSFDEGSGDTAHDSSGNGNDGTIYGAGWAAGVSGSALYFDGINDYVEVADDSSLRPSYITLCAWVKPQAPIDHAIIGKSVYSDASNEQYALMTKPGGIGRGYVKRNSVCAPGSGWYSVSSQTVQQQGKWDLLTYTWDGSVLTFYVNDNIEDSNTSVPPGPIDDCPGGTLRMGLWWAIVASLRIFL